MASGHTNTPAKQLVLAYVMMLASAQTIEDSTTLYDTLTTGYNINIRPVEDQSQPVIVNVTFDLVSIRELDEINGKFSIVGIMWMIWDEPRMRWNPTLYNNIYTTTIANKDVWKLDLIIAHQIDTVRSVGYHHEWYPVRYYYNGVALWAPGDVMTTTCSIDIAYYPFDTQKCDIMFVPWGSEKNEILFHINEKDVSMKFFTQNGEWSLEQAYASSGIIDNVYPVYIVTIELRRRPTFVIVNVVLPILIMGLLNVLVFCLPPKSGERVSYAITVLLAIAVFLTLVGDNMPKTSQPMSTICYFLLTNLIMSSMIMIATVLNLRLYHRDKQIAVPSWLVTLVFVMKCKRPTKRTQVHKMKECEDGDDEKKVKQEKPSSAKWTMPFYMTEAGDYVTWRDVSRAVDVLFGMLSILWLLITAASFFIMVATHSVPGIDE